MLKEETIEFLKAVPPFNFLRDEDLGEIAEDVSLEYYPKGMKILSQNGPPADHLRLIKKGGVKVYVITEKGDELTIDYRSEAEQFGIVSMISGDRSRANIIAVEDTICYLIPRRRILGILEQNPQVNEFFVKSFFLNFIDRTYEETRKRFAIIGEGERVLFTTPVKDIVRKAAVTALEDMPIKDAALRMSQEGISSLIIVNGSNVPTGIITDRDLRDKVVARGRDFDEPVKLIMSSPLIRVYADEFCFEALLKMIRYNIHHLLVVEEGALIGVVTNHDFMVLQGSSPTVFVKEIEDAQNVDDLSAARPKLAKVVSELLREGARASNITGLITEVAEKFVMRVVDIVERKLGAPPMPYSLFFYSDGGRREFTLNLQIRMGIVYDETQNPGALSRTENYFDEFVRVLRETMTDCGFSCAEECISRGSIMSMGQWKRAFKMWASGPFAYEMDEGFFDMYPIRGDEALVDSLKDYLWKLASESEDLMDFLATRTVKNRPPLGFFKRFVVEKSGKHINELNLYEKGVRPLVDSIRVFSLEKRIKEPSTIKRTHILRDRYSFQLAGDVEQALEYIFALLIHDQLGHSENGTSIDSFLNPEMLSNLEKKTLKETFLLIARLYDIIEKGYRTERVEG